MCGPRPTVARADSRLSPLGLLLRAQAGVAITPGVDFEEPGSGLGEGRVRLGFPGATEDVREAMRVLGEWWVSPAGLKLRGKA